jgi:phenylpropionate dioxygenase-like ring-hydroxylating dioxygenase large terminal subunit
MRHDEQVRLIKELCARLDDGTNVDAGGLRRNPTSSYTDTVLAKREWDEWFRNMPQLLGLSGDLPEPNSFLTNNDYGTPILATRDSSGGFRAFVNSCRHRGAIVESAERGTKRRFTCPFHAWTYDPAGTLVGLPKADHFGEVDNDCMGLVELPAEERHGMLFVHPQPDGSIDLDWLLGEWFNDEFATWDFGGLERLSSDAYDTPCNWKLAMDTFGETYHFTSLHSDTLALNFHGNVQCYDEDAHLHRMILCKRAIDQMRHLPEDQWDITVAGLPVYWLFPNVILMPFELGVLLVRAVPSPDDPGRHLSRVDFYIRPETIAAHTDQAEFADMKQFAAGIARTFSEVIRDEDYVMSSSQQTAANAGALEEIVFGRNEPALHHYHNTYRRLLGEDLLPLLDSIGTP